MTNEEKKYNNNTSKQYPAYIDDYTGQVFNVTEDQFEREFKGKSILNQAHEKVELKFDGFILHEPPRRLYEGESYNLKKISRSEDCITAICKAVPKQ